MNPTVLHQYERAPGHCFTCKAAQRDVADGRELIVDLGVELESPVTADPNSPGFQVQYLTEPLVICETCLVELGGMIGMERRSVVEQVRSEAARWRAMADQEAQKVKDLSDAVDGLRRAGYAAVAAAHNSEDGDRAGLIAQLRGEGLSWAQVAEAVGLSASRCRQLAKTSEAVADAS